MVSQQLPLAISYAIFITARYVTLIMSVNGLDFHSEVRFPLRFHAISCELTLIFMRFSLIVCCIWACYTDLDPLAARNQKCHFHISSLPSHSYAIFIDHALQLANGSHIGMLHSSGPALWQKSFITTRILARMKAGINSQKASMKLVSTRRNIRMARASSQQKPRIWLETARNSYANRWKPL